VEESSSSQFVLVLVLVLEFMIYLWQAEQFCSDSTFQSRIKSFPCRSCHSALSSGVFPGGYQFKFVILSGSRSFAAGFRWQSRQKVMLNG